MMSTEARIIETLQARCAGARDDVALGIGDDGAVIEAGGRQLVVATDVLVEGTHFLADAPADSLGHRCLAVNLSDLAAMGAEPAWATLTLTLPGFDAAWLDSFAAGFAALANGCNVALVGGDTVRGPLSAGVTLIGRATAAGYVTRSGAAAGDDIWITGRPGMAGAGRLLLAGELPATASGEACIRCFRYPQPRVTAGQRLAPLANAMIDVSDGLDTDLRRLLAASDAGADVVVPVPQLLVDSFGERHGAQLCLHGGEDYELLFTAGSAARTAIAEIGAALGLPVTRIGAVTADAALRWSLGGKPLDSSHGAFEHFADGS